MLLIEKILGENESLQGFEVCDGTTGYEWLNHFSRVLLFPEGHTELKEIWRQVSNLAPSFEPVLIDAKRRVLETLLVSEFTVLTRLLARIAAGHYSTRDYSEDSLRQALTLFVLHFPVYRTYIRGRTANARDRRTIELAIRQGARGLVCGGRRHLRFPARCDHARPAASGARRRTAALACAASPQNCSSSPGPLMAKSLEDTAFYRFPLLLALNEVGGNPAAEPMPLATFHAHMSERARQWPSGLTATATHDTKRGEDAECAFSRLAELSGDWTSAIGRWKTLERALRRARRAASDARRSSTNT